MIDQVRGEVLKITGDAAVIAIGGIGLRVQMPTGDLAKLKGIVTVHTVLHVREDDLQLFGFADERGRELFRLLMSVNGVGAKHALAILSYHPPEKLERHIVAGDDGALALVSGIGKKIAQRIVLELREKVGAGTPEEMMPAVAPGPLAEVREALKGLGYAPAEIQAALAGLPEDGDAETLLRHALTGLSKELV